MAVALRYVDRKGCVIERFIGILHVTDTIAVSLKAAIESKFVLLGLSISRLRGQGYDGASNMQGEFSGLKSLILAENKSAHFVHCFAHQLQLTLVVIAKNHKNLALFFQHITSLTNVVGGSYKRKDMLREKQLRKVTEQIQSGEITTRRGLNQQIILQQAGDTRWGSHYNVIVNLIVMFSSVVELLEIIENDGRLSDQRAEASNLLDVIQCFEFVFLLHLMKTVLGITNELSQALQRKDQDLVNAMDLVKSCKRRFQYMRDCGWNSLLQETCEFCKKNLICIPKMEYLYVARGRSRCGVHEVTNLHHFRNSLFYTVIDDQIGELNGRFNEVNTELLLCMACLNPLNSFSAFDKQKLIRFAEFYPSEFSPVQLLLLDNQLQNYIIDVKGHNEFLELKGVGDLAQKMIETKKDVVYHLVYCLVKLSLILLVATATVERAFSAMKIIKSSLRN